MAAGKAQSGKAAAASTGGKRPNALQKPLQPSKELAAVVGSEPLARGEVVSRVWDYIKKNNLRTRRTSARSWLMPSWSRCSGRRR
jgi:chromatin remodeling complex protein RSC6